MRRKDRLPELLAPAGDFDCLIAAVNAGADAVYIGGKSFGARAYAKNFDIDEIKKAVVYCHIHGAKLYVTMNTLLSDSELASAVEFAAELYRIGVDALIIADLGLISLLHRFVPGMELHASTQMSVHNSLGADEAYGMGCVRVVLARELSRENIEKVTDVCKAETEVFVHGALCVCHSGQCLFSSLVGGRSGNRGECAQPCRLPYNGGKYPLSLADLSLAGHIRELCECGVASLKIEGRMKSAEYVYAVVSIYRSLLDEYRDANREENEQLRRVFSRGGFTDGYFSDDLASRSMTGIRSEQDKEASKLIRKADVTPARVKIFARAELKLGQAASLELYTSNGRSARAFADEPQIAKSAPLTEESVKERLSKMGNTFFSLSPLDIRITLDEGINLSPAALNALRRNAVTALESIGYEDRVCFEPPSLDQINSENRTTLPQMNTAVFYDPDAAAKVCDEPIFDFDAVFVPLVNWRDCCGDFANGIALPPVIMENELADVWQILARVKKTGVKYALVENIGQFSLAKELGFVPIADFRLNITNTHAKDAVHMLGAAHCILSAELTAGAVRKIGGGAIVCGRVPLMITERCFMKENFGCENCSHCALTDRKGARFPMIREYNHRTLILNSAVTYMGDKDSELGRKEKAGRHFIFTVESTDQIKKLLSAYRKGYEMPGGNAPRRIGRRSV